MFDPLHRLKTLATVVDGCKGKYSFYTPPPPNNEVVGGHTGFTMPVRL